MSDEGDKFKVKAKAKAKNDVQGFSKAFRALRALTRQSKRPGAGGSSGSSRPSRGSPVAKVGGSQQRCSVRLTYAKNKGDGQWAAHGKYIARESASLETELEKVSQAEQAAELAQQQASEMLETDQPTLTPEEIANGNPGRSDIPGGRYDIDPARADAGRISALHKPYLSQYQREGAPRSINSVRGLSSIGVVHFPAGLKCFCRVMHLVTWSKEEPNDLTHCDGEIMANLERMEKANK